MSALEQYQAECAAGKIAAKDREIAELKQQLETVTKGSFDATAVMAQENLLLRAALTKAHDAMFSWHSSEYASHPLCKEVYEALGKPNK